MANGSGNRNNDWGPFIKRARVAAWQVTKTTVGGAVAVSIPVGIWWYYARQERAKVAKEVATRIRIPGQTTTDDMLIEKCRPGDIVLFDRRWETCASGPWACLACIVSKTFLCGQSKNSIRSVDHGNFDHVGVIVPGFVDPKKKADAFDPSNLLLMEATPQGIVARSLKTRLERSQSRSVLLIQLNVPGEQRDFQSSNADDDDESRPLSSRELSVIRTRKHIERELTHFRDKWLALGQQHNMQWKYSTLAIGGGIAYGLGLADYLESPVSPSAFLTLIGLQQAAVAQNLNERQERLIIKPEDFLRNPRIDPSPIPIRLRPGFRFLAPIALRELL